mmetsp:Transcript_1168/g.2552  ORF Transcript_1168/g.2552 Transcript_1168/m.2552 type:complete len:546 (-) Transcript_1168:2-1639(-)
MILLNKHLMSGPFPFALALTIWHMCVCSVFGAVLFLFVPDWFATVQHLWRPSRAARADSVGATATPSPEEAENRGGNSSTRGSKPSSRAQIFRAYACFLIPNALCFGLTVVLSNLAYRHATVTFLQMMKELNVVVVYAMSLLVALEVFDAQLTLALVIVVFGAVFSVGGERNFSLVALGVQGGSQLLDSARMVSTNKVLMSARTGSLGESVNKGGAPPARAAPAAGNNATTGKVVHVKGKVAPAGVLGNDGFRSNVTEVADAEDAAAASEQETSTGASTPRAGEPDSCCLLPDESGARGTSSSAGCGVSSLGICCGDAELLVRVDPWSFLLLVCPICFLLLSLAGLFAFSGDEVRNIVGKFGEHYELLLLNGAMALGVNVIMAISLGAFTATTYTLMGMLKHVAIVFGGVAAFGDVIPLDQGLGYAVQIAGVLWYTMLRNRKMLEWAGADKLEGLLPGEDEDRLVVNADKVDVEDEMLVADPRQAEAVKDEEERGPAGESTASGVESSESLWEEQEHPLLRRAPLRLGGEKGSESGGGRGGSLHL